MNRKTNKFQCPYCKRNSNDLYIDGIIYDFIKDQNNEKIEEIFLDKDLNIILEDNSPISEIFTNSNSNDETSKTELKKIIKKSKKIKKLSKSEKNKNKNHYLREPEVIHITDDESEIKEDEINHKNNKEINTKDKNDIITDLGYLFDNIRKDILSHSKKIYEKSKSKKNKSCSKTEKNKYISNINLGDNKNDLFISNDKNRFKLKFENPFNKMLTKKRKRINFNWSES